MARLTVKLHGKEVSTLALDQSREYIVGRNADCDVVLDGIKGISRQHFKLYHNGSQWTAELMSRLGALICEGESVESVSLEHGMALSVPPYEFVFNDKGGALTTTAGINNKDTNDVSNADTALVPMHGQNPSGEPKAPHEESFVGSLDATTVGISSLVAYLKVFTNSGEVGQVLKLEGNFWVAGRDEHCEIYLNDQQVSRRHFELARSNSGYFITDLGSANGTGVNGLPLLANEPTPLQSGDTITIMSLTLRFEIHDPRFENKLQVIQPQMPMAPFPQQYPVPMGGDMYYPTPHYPMPHGDGPAVVKVENPSWMARVKSFDYKNFDYKKNKVRIAIAICAVMMVVGLLSGESEQSGQTDSASTNGQVALNKLTPEQKKLVGDALELAKSHYHGANYALCLSEIKKVHDIVPFYENSKDIEGLCTQAHEMMTINSEKERLERLRIEQEQQILSVVETCKAKMTENTTLQELETCLEPAIEMNPEHAMYTELRNIIQIREEEKRSKLEAAEEQRRRAREGLRKLELAKTLRGRGDLRAAIENYEAFLSGHYPDSGDKKEEAQRELATVRKELSEKVRVKLNECKKLHAENKFKDAILSCDEAIKEDPNAEEARSFRRSVQADLRREMMNLYQDSVLEESLGNIEAAKEKWKQILRENMPDDEFYKKAKRQLNQYGGGE